MGVVGREPELAAIEHHLHRAREGSGGVVLVEGEAGIGKTHLVRAAEERARARRMAVCAGRCELLERARPFGPFVEALGKHVASGTSRFAAQEAIIDDVETRVAATPLLLAIDDAQWADEPSLGALAALGRRAGDLPLAVVVAHRPTPRLPERVVEVLLASGARTVTLEPLAPGAVVALVTALLGAPPSDGLRRLVEGAHGNPFLVMELVTALRDEQAIVVDEGVADTTFHGLPPTLRQTVLRRVRALSPDALGILQAAAVLGGPFDLGDLAAMTERSPVSLHTDVFQALEARLLEEQGARLRFRHDLIREAIYAHMPAAIQESLHDQAVRALTARDAPATEVARHLLRAGANDPQHAAAAMDQVRRAVRELGGTDPEAALELVDGALRLPLADDHDHDRRQAPRVELLTERIGLLAAAGRLAEGEATARQVLATDVPPALRTEVELALAEVLLLAGNPAEAVTVLDAAREQATDEVAQARVVADAAWARLIGFDLDGAAREADRAVAWGERRDDALVLTSGLSVQCRLAAFAVDFDRAIDRGRAAVAASVRGGTRAAHRTPHYYLGLSLMNADHADEAIAVLNQGRRIAESAGLVSAAAMYHSALITCCFHAGRWDEGTAEAEAARLLQADTGTRRDVMQIEAMLGLMWLHRGEDAAAGEALARAEADLATPGYDVGGVIWLRWLRAAFAEASGDLAGAARLLGTTFGLVSGSGVESVKLWFGPEVVRLAVEQGDTARAVEVAAAVAEVAARAGTAGASGAADCCAGLAHRDPDRLTAAVDAYRRSSRRFDLARAADAAGQLLAERGRTDAAVRAFDEAVGVLEELGAARDARRVGARLRELGVRRGARGPRARPATGPASLTPVEREVLRLVAGGLTNPQIAERMFVSRRTVETHVGHLYAKLGVRSRVALARFEPDPSPPPPPP